MSKTTPLWKDVVKQRLNVVRFLKQEALATNAELQAAYGDKPLPPKSIALLRRAVLNNVSHAERYNDVGLRKKLEELASLPGASKTLLPHKRPNTSKGKVLRIVPSAVDKLAGLKSFLDEVVLPGLFPFTAGSDVKTVVITVGVDSEGNPTISRKIGRTIVEWDEQTLDAKAQKEMA